MFRSKTIFVLGAGASHEFGLPLGSQLANQIRNMMDVSYDAANNVTGNVDRNFLIEASRHLGVDMPTVLGAAARLRQGLPLRKSIDDFLDIHREDRLLVSLGKAAIVKAILQAENASRLSVDTRRESAPDFQRNVDTWLAKVVKMLGQEGPDALAENAIFVCFNYDRTLEFFLFHAIQALYGYTPPKASELVGRIKVFRPYGCVGEVHPDQIKFEARGIPSNKDSFERSAAIRTYSEEANSDQMTLIQEALKSGEQMIFLGFGFHEQNVKLLTLPGKLKPMRVFATAYGIAQPELPPLQGRIGDIFLHRPAITFFQGECNRLFEEYWYTFSQM